MPTPEIVTIPYMDPETEEDPRTMPQWLKIYRPAEVAAPYPTIFLLPSTANFEITDYYQRVAKRFMARGYAIVLVNVGDKMAEEGDLYLQKGLGATNIGAKACALAWVRRRQECLCTMRRCGWRLCRRVRIRFLLRVR